MARILSKISLPYFNTKGSVRTMFDYDKAMSDTDNCIFTNTNHSWLPDEAEREDEENDE